MGVCPCQPRASGSILHLHLCLHLHLQAALLAFHGPGMGKAVMRGVHSAQGNLFR